MRSTVGVEARLTLEIATTTVLPAGLRYQTELATNVASLKAIGMDAETGILDEVSSAIKALREGINNLRREVSREHDGTMEELATRLQTVVIPAMDGVRAAADELEGLVADDLWPLATYQEMLFIL
jgi:glutamine synthetase